MSLASVHTRVIGKIQINTFAYNKDVFKIIVKRLLRSNIFHSVCTQSINHNSQSKRKLCNCDEILKFIVCEFHSEAERFSQVFVPVIIGNFQLKLHHYLICELLYLHDRLLRTRKDFFIDDVKEKALFTACKYKEDCMCKLHEILTISKRFLNQNSNSSQNNSVNKVNNTCFKEVMKELALNNLIPLSSKDLPIDSFKLQKVLDVCNKYYLPDEMTMGILSSLESVKTGYNQSNTEAVQSTESDFGHNLLRNNNDIRSFILNKNEDSWNLLTNNSTKKQNISYYSPNLKENDTNGSNVNFRRQNQHIERPINNFEIMHNSHNRSGSSMRNSRIGRNSYNRMSNNPDSNRWRVFNDRSYHPTTLRPSLEPQYSDSIRGIQSEKRNNFHWSNEAGSLANRNIASRGNLSRRLTPYHKYYADDADDEAYLNYNEEEELGGESNRWYNTMDGNTFEVVIDDECYDIGNAETITVRDGDGNLKRYIDSEKIAPVNSRQSENMRSSMPRKSKKKVSFLNRDNKRDNGCGCDSSTLAKAVLCQEANSMDTLMSVLNRQIDQNEAHQCLKLSVRAEHVIKRPDFPDNMANCNPSDCFKISSEVQAQWENLNCDEESKTPALPFDLNYNVDGNYLNTNFKSVGTSPYNIGNSTINRARESQRISQHMSDICDKAMQTDKFLFIETPNERMIMSPSSFDQTKPTPFSKISVGMNTERDSFKRLLSKGFHENLQHNFDESCSQFYFFEDQNKRIICSPNELCFNNKETQTNQYQLKSSLHNSTMQPNDYKVPSYMQREYRPNVKFNDSYLKPSVGGYYQDSRQNSSYLHSNYNLPMSQDQRFTQNNFDPRVESLHNAMRDIETNETLTTGSRAYSLQPYINSVDNNSFTTLKNEDSNLTTKQINHSSSIHMNQNISNSPEDFYYIESRKLSPIIDVHTSSQYNQFMGIQKINNSNGSLTQFRNQSRDIKQNSNKYYKFSLNQKNNSNSVFNEKKQTKMPMHFNYNKGFPNETCKCLRNSTNNFKNNLGKQKKITKYVINYSHRNNLKYCHYFKEFKKANETLIYKKRFKCHCEHSKIPVIPSQKNCTKIVYDDLNVDPNDEYSGPYAKSIQYVREKLKSKRKDSKRSSNLISSEGSSNSKSFKDLLKKLNRKLRDRFNNNEDSNTKFRVKSTNKKIGISKDMKKNLCEISKICNIDDINNKVVFIMCPENQTTFKKSMENQLKGHANFNNKEAIVRNMNLEDITYQNHAIKGMKNGNKYSEVEVYFNPT